MVCGETEVTASSLRETIDQLSVREDEDQTTGFEKHFQVTQLHKFSCMLVNVSAQK